MIIPLRKRYVRGLSYKNMKSPNGNSGNKGKGKSKTGKSDPVVGRKTFFVNMSDQPEFCAATSVRLPARGMIVVHQGKKFIDHKAAAAV